MFMHFEKRIVLLFSELSTNRAVRPDEMARDEARHGKAFKGLLERYFGK